MNCCDFRHIFKAFASANRGHLDNSFFDVLSSREWRRVSPRLEGGAMPLYVIERSMPGMGEMGPDELQGAAAHSNETLDAMRAEGKEISWRHSYGTADKSFCIYEAADEGLVREHSERSGFPADVISEVGGIIGPETADG